MTTETTLATAAATSPAEIARVVESLVVRGDISQLSTADRSQYYLRMCASLGLNPTTQPLAFLKLNGKDVLYVTRSATDQLAAMHRVNREIIDGPKVIDLGGTKAVYAVCRATLPNGRVETATAAIPATDLINAVMKVETKAKRRATLSILGLGVSLDESEIDTIPTAVRGEPAALATPTPAVPAAITAAASCAAAAAAYAAAVNGTDPSDPILAAWRAECLGAAAHVVRDHGAVVSDAGAKAIVCSPALAALVDEALGLVTAGKTDTLPGWWLQGQAAIGALSDADRAALEAVCARLLARTVELSSAATRYALAAWRAAAAPRTREPGDDDGDEPPPSAPQPPPQGRRARATATGPTGDAAPADGPAAWLGDDAAAEAHAAGWSHARHVEASVRRHGPTVSGDAYDRLVRVAAARLEAMSPADSYGTRPTLAGLHRTVSRWAAEGPVMQRRAA